MSSNALSYDYFIFKELVYEYAPSVMSETEARIKRKLKYHKLGPYNQSRVDYIRSLKETLASEIRLERASKYFKKTASRFAVIDDFDVASMAKDYSLLYQDLTVEDLRDMIGWGIHMLYTR